jgi:hypothetical protein
MPDDLNLSLPPRKSPRGRSGALQAVAVAVIIVAAAVLLYFFFGGKQRVPAPSGLSGKELQTLGLKLENAHLPAAAARTWTEYIESTKPGKDETARIWFRIGTLYQDGSDYEHALEAYYRCEAIAKMDELEPEISKRSAECLEAMGKFAALDYELEERTAVGKPDTSKGGEIVAEVGTWKITRADLDMMIEAEIDAQLSQLAGDMTPEQRQKQKEKYLEGIFKEGNREQWLERFIAQEILYRRAVDEKLNEDAQFRALSRNIEREILAQKVLQREYASRINITPDDVRAYYDAHKDDFKKDGRAQPFDQVKNDVAAAVKTQKEAAIQQQLFAELKDKYNVVIHRAALGGK